MATSKPDAADCVFCAIVRGEMPATFVHQDDVAVAFMDIRPVQRGHLLVVPRAHAKLLTQLDSTILTTLWSVATELNLALRNSDLPVEAVSVYVADGDAAGQEVAHVHIHLIPRREGDGFGFRFPQGYGTQPPRAELESIGSMIRESLRAVDDGRGD